MSIANAADEQSQHASLPITVEDGDDDEAVDTAELEAVGEFVREGSSIVIHVVEDTLPDVSDSDVDDEQGGGMMERLRSVESLGVRADSEEWKLIGVCQRRRPRGSTTTKAAALNADDDEDWEYRCYWEHAPTSTWERRGYLKDLGYGAELAAFDRLKKNQVADLNARFHALALQHQQERASRRDENTTLPPAMDEALRKPRRVLRIDTTTARPQRSLSVAIETPVPQVASAAPRAFVSKRKAAPPSNVRKTVPSTSVASVPERDPGGTHVMSTLREVGYAFIRLADQVHGGDACKLPMVASSLHHMLGVRVLRCGSLRAAISGDKDHYHVYVWRREAPQKSVCLSLGDLPAYHLQWMNPRSPQDLTALHQRAETEYAESKQRLRFPSVPSSAQDMWLALTVGHFRPYTTLLLSTERLPI